MGILVLRRARLAPRREMLEVPKRRPAKRATQVPRGAVKAKSITAGHFTKVPFRFPEDQHAWLFDLSCQLGGIPYSSLFSYFVLDWCGINPLTQPAPTPQPVDVSTAAPATTTTTTTRPSFVSKQLPLMFADQLIAICDEEAALVGLSRAAFVRSVLYQYMRGWTFNRPPFAPKRDFLPIPKRRPNRTTRTRGELTKITLKIHEELVDWLYELQWELGGMPYASVIQYFLLAWFEINPLTRRDTSPLFQHADESLDQRRESEQVPPPPSSPSRSPAPRSADAARSQPRKPIKRVR